MKKYIFLVLMLLLLLFLPIPEYHELNQIKILNSIQITCINHQYYVIYKEIVPEKDNNRIHYRYPTYESYGTDLSSIKKDFDQKYHSLFYYDRIKFISTNCSNIDEISQVYSISHNKIQYQNS